MRVLCVLVAAAAATLCAGYPASYIEVNEESLWRAFKATYNKRYETPDEDVRRRAIFKANLLRGAEMEAESVTDVQFGVSPFSDLTQAEFKAQHTSGFGPPRKPKKGLLGSRRGVARNESDIAQRRSRRGRRRPRRGRLANDSPAWSSLPGSHFTDTPSALRNLPVSVPAGHVAPAGTTLTFACPAAGTSGPVCAAFAFAHADAGGGVCKSGGDGHAALAAVLAEAGWEPAYCGPRFKTGAGANLTAHPLKGYVRRLRPGETRTITLPEAVRFLAVGLEKGVVCPERVALRDCLAPTKCYGGEANQTTCPMDEVRSVQAAGDGPPAWEWPLSL